VVSNIIHSITQVFHIINPFNFFQTMVYVVEKSAESAADKLREQLSPPVQDAFLMLLNFSSMGLDGVQGGRFVGPTFDLWQRAFKVAMILFPLVATINAATVLTEGLSAPIARAEAFKSVTTSILNFLFAWGSFLIVNYALKIGWGTTSLLLDGAGAGDLDGWLKALAGTVVGGLVSLAGMPGMGLVFFYIFLFLVFLMLMLVFAMLISYYALILIAIVLIVIAPIVIVVGDLPQFRWLYGMWVKVASGVVFVPIANAILFQLWDSFGLVGGPGTIMAPIISLGLVSLIITVNFTIGKFVFAPVFEAHKQAFGATVALAKVVGDIAAGIVSGGASLGFSAAAGGAGGGSGDGGITPPASGLGGIGDPRSDASNSIRAGWQPNSFAGRVMHASGQAQSDGYQQMVRDRQREERANQGRQGSGSAPADSQADPASISPDFLSGYFGSPQSLSGDASRKAVSQMNQKYVGSMDRFHTGAQQVLAARGIAGPASFQASLPIGQSADWTAGRMAAAAVGGGVLPTVDVAKFAVHGQDAARNDLHAMIAGEFPPVGDLPGYLQPSAFYLSQFAGNAEGGGSFEMGAFTEQTLAQYRSALDQHFKNA
jgi:hypothetical protein